MTVTVRISDGVADDIAARLIDEPPFDRIEGAGVVELTADEAAHLLDDAVHQSELEHSFGMVTAYRSLATADPLHAPQFLAALDMVRRTGALEVQIRWSDDEEPVVWFVTARHNVGPDLMPRPASEPGRVHWKVGAGLHPYTAAINLLEELMDGGMCAHCKRPSGVTEDFAGRMPLDVAICWYRFDPELATFRRGCE